MRQFQCLPTTYVTENKEENYLEMYMSIVFSSFKHPILPISIKTANCLYLHDRYILKFEFMNCLVRAFAASMHIVWTDLKTRANSSANVQTRQSIRC